MSQKIVWFRLRTRAGNRERAEQLHAVMSGAPIENSAPLGQIPDSVRQSLTAQVDQAKTHANLEFETAIYDAETKTVTFLSPRKVVFRSQGGRWAIQL